MSRVGRSPVYFEKTVNVTVGAGNELVVKGTKGSLSVKLHPKVKAKIVDGRIELTMEGQEVGNFFGLARALVQNAVTGVAKGWTKELELVGVGYRAAVSGKKLEINVGFSHPVHYEIPEGIEIKVDKQTKIIVSGSDRQKVSQVATVIRGFRPPEPYLGKGIKIVGEVIRRKEGKAAGK